VSSSVTKTSRPAASKAPFELDQPLARILRRCALKFTLPSKSSSTHGIQTVSDARPGPRQRLEIARLQPGHSARSPADRFAGRRALRPPPPRVRRRGQLRHPLVSDWGMPTSRKLPFAYAPAPTSLRTTSVAERRRTQLAMAVPGAPGLACAGWLPERRYGPQTALKHPPPGLP